MEQNFSPGSTYTQLIFYLDKSRGSVEAGQTELLRGDRTVGMTWDLSAGMSGGRGVVGQFVKHAPVE